LPKPTQQLCGTCELELASWVCEDCVEEEKYSCDLCKIDLHNLCRTMATHNPRPIEIDSYKLCDLCEEDLAVWQCVECESEEFFCVECNEDVHKSSTHKPVRILWGITAEEEECHRLFDEIDRDKSGTIDEEELKVLLGKLGKNPTKEQVTQMMKRIDTDGNGLIAFEEFMEFWIGLVKSTKKKAEKKKQKVLEGKGIADLKALFDSIDTDGSGHLNQTEMRKLCGVIGRFPTEAQFQAFWKRLDSNRDGNISFQEFESVLGSKLKKVIAMRESKGAKQEGKN